MSERAGAGQVGSGRTRGASAGGAPSAVAAGSWARALATVGLLLLSLAAGCAEHPAEVAREHRERGRAYLEAGRYREAGIEYQAAVQALPKDAEALYGLAKALEVQGRLRQYRRYLTRALEADPGHARSCTEMAGLLWAGGNYPQALELARRAAAAPEAPTQARRIEARALTDLGRLEEARAVWAQVLAGPAPLETDYVEAARVEAAAAGASEAEAILRRGLERLPEAAELLLALAQLLAARGDGAAAQALVDRAVEAAPGSPAAREGKARFLLGLGRVGEALAFLERSQQELAGDPQKGPEMALLRARVLLRLGELEKAEAVLEAARRQAPDHPGLAATAADVAIVRGRTEEARRLLPLALRYDPTGRTARLLEARLYLKQGRSLWALEVLEGLVAGGDLSVDTHYLYARALAEQKRWAQARREYEQILARLPDHLPARLDLAALLRAQGEGKKAVAVLDGVPRALADTARLRFERARALLDAGDPEGAAALLEGLAAGEAANPVLEKLLGDVARARGRREEARGHYERARKAAPQATEPLFALVDLLAADPKRVPEAVALLEEDLARNGDRAPVLDRLASLHLRAGNRVAAAKAAERSAMVEPNFGKTRVLQARIQLAAGQEAEAAVTLQEAIALDPFDPEPYVLLAEIYEGREDWDQVEATYQRLLDRSPGEPTAANNLAALYLRQGKLPEALRLAREAYVGAPAEAAVLDTLGWTLERLGRHEEAAPLLERAAAAYPSHPEVQLHRGVNLRSLGQTERAARVLGRVAELAPGSREAERALALLQGNGEARVSP